MVDSLKIAAEPRERAGKGAARTVRRAGRVPGVVYGDKQAAELISLEPREIEREIHKPGFYTRLFSIEVGGKSILALPRDVQLHPVTDRAEHVDFMRVNDKTRIRVSVPVKFLNPEKSPGLKRGGVLNVVAHDIDVYCTISSIPRQIEIDLSGLEINDSVHMSTVKLPEGVTPRIRENFTVAAVGAPSALKSAEEEAAEAAAKAAAAPGAEGAAAPAAGAAAPAAGAAAGAKPAAGAAPAAAAAPAKGGGKK